MPRVPHPTIRVTVDLKPEYVEKIDEMAEERDSTRSAIIRDIIRSYFKKQEINPDDDEE